MSNEPKASPEMYLKYCNIFFISSIVTMWVLLDDLRPVENEFSNELQGVRPTEIKFFNNNDRTTSLDCGMTLMNDNTSSKNPLVICYLLSDLSIDVKFRYIHKVVHCQIPHSSGFFYLLKREAIAKFKNDLAEIETGDIYFEDQNNQEIESAFHFNTLLNNIDQNGQNQYDLDLKIQIKKRKVYSDWKIGDVLREIYNYKIDVLKMVQVEFDMNSLPKSSPPLSTEVQDKIAEQLEDKKIVFKRVYANEATIREFILVVLVNTVKFVNIHNDPTTELLVEKQLEGRHGYGTLDFMVMIQKFFMLIMEANSVEEGIAQILVQIRSASEVLGKRKLDQTDFEFEIEKMPLIGIVTTGGVWVFICNTGQKIEIVSEKFECSYTGNMEEINNQRLKRSRIDQ
ncbi:10008_t:CDS:2 [Rhizophagus irregularis]|nr:10008_t:CDS:2 [Rhizophagus irregularis]